MTLFLFGDAHKQHWKMSIGTVIALLNPSLKAEVKNKVRKCTSVYLWVCTYLNTLLYIYKYYAYILYACDHQPVTVLTACPHQDQVSGIPYTLSLDHPDKLMEVGQSCDFTQCKATVKSGGRRCNNFANMYVHESTVPSYILHAYVYTNVQCMQ